MEKIKNHMKLKYFVILFFVFFAAMIIFGCEPSGIGSSDYGTAQIEGFVMDANTIDVIENVRVMTNPESDTVLSTQNGKFIIDNYFLNNNPQEITLIATKTGYYTSEVKAILRTGETANITILMIPK